MKKILTLSIFLLFVGLNSLQSSITCGASTNKFNDTSIDEVFNEYKDDLSIPLFNLTQIEKDIREVEKILKESKVISFEVYRHESKNGIHLRWDHKGLQFMAKDYSWSHINTGTEEAKFLVHKDLAIVLKKGAEEMKKLRKQS